MAKKDNDKYLAFYKEFGQVLKEGPAEDQSNKEKNLNLLRFSSTKTDNESQEHSLKDYVERMQEGQDKIYYITAENFLAAKNSPHLEVFRKKGLEVLILSDRVDEWMMGYVNEFDGKSFQSVSKGELDLSKFERTYHQIH
jgi:molecular chaperone HtpG